MDPMTNEEAAAVHQYVMDYQGDLIIRTAMLGLDGVGKSNIITRLNRNAIIDEDAIDPGRSDSFALRTVIARKRVLCQGMVQSGGLTRSAAEDSEGYIVTRHCEACFLIYNVGDRASFDAARSFLENFIRKRPSCRGEDCDLIECAPPQRLAFMMANKIDRSEDERLVARGEGEELCASAGAVYLETSARTGEGVNPEVLERLVSRILLHRIIEKEKVLEQAREGEIEAASTSVGEANPSMGKTFGSKVYGALGLKSIQSLSGNSRKGR